MLRNLSYKTEKYFFKIKIMDNITENKNRKSFDYNAIDAMESFNPFVKKKIYHCRVFILLPTLVPKPFL